MTGNLEVKEHKLSTELGEALVGERPDLVA